MPYTGPLRDEPLAIELHNTIYAVGGVIVDGLADAAQADAWIDAISARATRDGQAPGPLVDDLIALRDAVRTSLAAAVDDAAQDPGALDAINRASARVRSSPIATLPTSGTPVRETDYHGATVADVVVAAIARDAIELLTGPERGQLRACGAPGCVLLFLKDHPRRAWCCNACGNRARQARHYRRQRAG